jgi:hypothetical protein
MAKLTKRDREKQAWLVARYIEATDLALALERRRSLVPYGVVYSARKVSTELLTQVISFRKSAAEEFN